MVENRRKKLYDELRNIGLDPGAYGEYYKAMDDPARRRKFYDSVTSKGVDIGSREYFEEAMTYPVPPASDPLEDYRKDAEEKKAAMDKFDADNAEFFREHEHRAKMLADYGGDLPVEQEAELHNAVNESLPAYEARKALRAQMQKEYDASPYARLRRLDPDGTAYRNMRKSEIDMETYSELLKNASGDEKKDIEERYRKAGEDYYRNPVVTGTNEENAKAAEDANSRVEEHMRELRDSHRDDEVRRPGFAERFAKAMSSGTGGDTVAPQIAENYDGENEDRSLAAAAENLNEDTAKIYRAPSRWGEETGLENFWKGAKETVSDADFWTMGLSGMQDALALDGVFDKIRAKLGTEDLTEEKIDKALTPLEKDLYEAFCRNAMAQAERSEDLSKGYQAGASAADSLMFMASFALTGGASEGAVKAMGRWLGKRLGVQALGKAGGLAAKAAGKAAQSAAMTLIQPTTYQGVLERVNRMERSDPGDPSSPMRFVDESNAALKGLGDAWVENFSEMVGGPIDKVLSLPLKGAGRLARRMFGDTKFLDLAEAFYNSSAVEALKKGGWNNYAGEVGEELVGAAMRQTLGVDDQALAQFFDKDNMDIMLLSFLPTMGMGGVVNTARAGVAIRDYDRADTKFRETSERLGMQPGSMEGLKNAETIGEVSSALTESLHSMLESGEKVSAEDVKSAVDLAKAAVRRRFYEDAGKLQVNGRREADLAALSDRYGTFWSDRGGGDREVTRVMWDGKPGFVTATDDSGLMSVTFDDGSKAMLREDELDTRDGMPLMEVTPLDAFLDGVDGSRRRKAESERMQMEGNDNLLRAQERLQPQTVVNIGTVDSKVAGTVQQWTPDGVVIVSEDGTAREYPWAEAQRLPLFDEDSAPEEPAVLTDAQQQEQAVKALEETDSRKRYYNMWRGRPVKFTDGGKEVSGTLEMARTDDDSASVRMRVRLEDGAEQEIDESQVVSVYDDWRKMEMPPSEVIDYGSSYEEAFGREEDVADAPAEAVAEDGSDAPSAEDAAVLPEEGPVEQAAGTRQQEQAAVPDLPLKADGSVDQKALWNRSPEAWAEWNDGKRKDGGANSEAYLGSVLKQVEGEGRALAKAYAKETDFDRRDELEGKMLANTERSQKIRTLIQGYVDARAAAETEKKERERREKVNARLEKERAALEANTPQTIEALAASMFSREDMRGKLDREDFKRELGWGDAELRRFWPWWAKKGRGRSLISIAEAMPEFDDRGLIPMDGGAEQKDTQAARDAVISVLQQALSPKDVTSFTRRQNEEMMQRLKQEEQDYADGYFMQNYGMTADEYMASEKAKKEMEGTEVIYSKPSLTDSSDGHLTEHLDGVPDLLPTQDNDGFSADKSTQSSVTKQENTGVSDGRAVQGLEGYSRKEIKDIVSDHVREALSDAGINAETVGAEIHGSRNRGDARKDSDLDVVVEYRGGIREDDMFNTLNGGENPLVIEGIKVDINPIRAEESGTLSDYMKRSEEYDAQLAESRQRKSRVNAERAATGRRQRLLSEPTRMDGDFGLVPVKYIKTAADITSNIEKIVSTLADNEKGMNDTGHPLSDYAGFIHGHGFLFNAQKQVEEYVRALDIVDPKITDEWKAAAGIRNAKELAGYVNELYEAKQTEIKPVGNGPFGAIYDKFRGKAKEAIEFLSRIRSGEAVGALHHKDIGEISIVWGNRNAGLEKILRKHPEVVDNLQPMLDGMRIVSESDNRIKLESPTHFAVISREYLGTPRDKWLLTAYEKKNSASDNTMDTDETLSGKRNGTATPQDTVSSANKSTQSYGTKQETRETPKEYVYRLNVRPFGVGNQPDGGRKVDDGSKFGAAAYDKPLSIDDIKHYTLTAITDAKQLEGKTFSVPFGKHSLIYNIGSVDENGNITYTMKSTREGAVESAPQTSTYTELEDKFNGKETEVEATAGKSKQSSETKQKDIPDLETEENLSGDTGDMSGSGTEKEEDFREYTKRRARENGFDERIDMSVSPEADNTGEIHGYGKNENIQAVRAKDGRVFYRVLVEGREDGHYAKEELLDEAGYAQNPFSRSGDMPKHIEFDTYDGAEAFDSQVAAGKFQKRKAEKPSRSAADRARAGERVNPLEVAQAVAEEGREELIRGENWELTGEPEKYKAGKKRDSHDVTWYIGKDKKKYGSTTAERDLLEALKDEYGGSVAAWNAYERGAFSLGENEAALLKKSAEAQDENRPQLQVKPDTDMDSSAAQKDKEYFEALERGDMETAQRIVNEAAEKAGYTTDSGYQGTSAFNGAAPWGNGYFLTKEERKEAWDNDEFDGDQTLGDYIERGIDAMNLDFIALNPRNYRAADSKRKEAIDNVRNAIRKKSRTITMYRSVPFDVKEGSFRNGDWVTPSRAYAVENARIHGWGDNYNIIEQEVPVDEIWWDGNDIAEWGYGRESDYINDTDFAYKNAENNRKLLDVITRDDNGEIIPPSRRFDSTKSDIRFGIVEDKGETTMDAPERKLAFDAVSQMLSDAGISVERLSDEAMRELAENANALETVSSQNEYQQTVVSSASGAKVIKKLDNLAGSLENAPQTKEKTFLGTLAEALGATKHGSNSQYATFEAKNGTVVTIRLANHNAATSTFDNHGEDNGISIVISARENAGMNNDGRAHVTEYYYDAIKLRKAEGKPLAEIVRSVKQSLYSGEYKDTTGLAQVEEVNPESVPELMTGGRTPKQRWVDNYVNAVHLVTGQDKRTIRKELAQKLEEARREAKELYADVLSGNFNSVTLRRIDNYIDNATDRNRFYRPLSQRLPERALLSLSEDARTNAVDALFSRICESAVPANGRTRAEGRRKIEERKEECLEGWAKATGNWHESIADFAPQSAFIKSGTDSDVYLSSEGYNVIKVSKGKFGNRKFPTDIDQVNLFNSVFPQSAYRILGYGRVDGKFVRFLEQPFVDFSNSQPLTTDERVEYMGMLGFEPHNEEKTVFSNGEIVVSDLQKSNIVKDADGNICVIDADVKLHTKDIGGTYTYPPVEADTEVPELMTVYHGSGAKFDRFDHSHMGEGEGAQAYGWGTYVTEVEGIGRTYARQTAVLKYKGESRDEVWAKALSGIAPYGTVYEIMTDMKVGLDFAGAKEGYRKTLKDRIDYYEKTGYLKFIEEDKRILAEVEALDESDFSFGDGRNFYTVEIPDDSGSDYLEWEGRIDRSLEKLGISEDEYERHDMVTGEDAYHYLEGKLGGAKEASGYLSKRGYVGISYPAQFLSGGRSDGARNYVIFNEDDAKIVDRIEFLKDGDAVYGAAVGGKILLNAERLNPNTPVHEYTHLWDRACRENNPELWRRGVELMKQTPVWKEVENDPNYAGLDEDGIASEVHSRLSGDNGEAVLTRMSQEIIDEGGSPIDMAAKFSVISRLKKWLSDFWHWVKDTMIPWSREEAERISVDDFVNMPLSDLAKGTKLSGKSETETERIVREAKADGTYMKAPNGRPSNLDESQWAQVRTKAFKAWFGDWEKSARIEKLRDSKPASISGKEIPISYDFRQNKKNALEYGKGLQGSYVNKDTGASIQLQRGRKNGGLHEVLQHNYKDREHIQSIAAIPQIIENSIYIDSEANKDIAKNPSVTEYQHYVCGLNIGGTDYTVLATVAVDKDGSRYYDHNLTRIEKGKLLDQIKGQAVNRESFDAMSGTNPTTLSGKDKRLISILQTDSSKAVDENGEPKVLYHGGPYRFSRFDTSRLGQSTGAESAKEGFFFTDSRDLAERFAENSIDELPTADVEKLVEERLSGMEGTELDDAYRAYRNDSGSYQDYMDETGRADDVEFLRDYSGAYEDGMTDDEVKRAFVMNEITEKIENGYFGDMQEVTEELSALGVEFGNTEAVFLDLRAPVVDDVKRDYFHEGESASPMTPTLKKAKSEGGDGAVFTSITEYGQKSPAAQYVVFSPNQIKSATDNLGEFSVENEDIRFQFAGEKGAGQMDRRDKSTMRLDNLAVARQMEGAGKDASAIKLATGWERGVDGKWRYEIPDLRLRPNESFERLYYEYAYYGSVYKEIREADLKDSPDYALYQRLQDKMNSIVDKQDEDAGILSYEEYERLEEQWNKANDEATRIEEKYGLIIPAFKLSEIIKAPELFKAYPSLRYYSVHTGDTQNPGAYAECDADDMTITINPYVIGRRQDKLERILVHEIQHAIQEIEGFALGGGPLQFELLFKEAKDELHARAYAHALEETAKGLGDARNQADAQKALIEEYRVSGLPLPDEETRTKGFNYFVRGYPDRSKDAVIRHFRLDESTRPDFDSYKEYMHVAGEVEARNASRRFDMDQIERRSTLASETEDVAREEQIDIGDLFDEKHAYSASIVTDRKERERLESEPTIKVYRAMQLVDGKLYPPMSGKVNGKWRDGIAVEDLGKVWEKADENPELADDKGRFVLNKGNGTSLKARYNPYIHTSTTPLNDQFSSAQSRPELVTVEVEIPESELTSGYKADKAKDSVGKVEWKAGAVQGRLSGTRTVILSRWDKPVRIVPDSEVADRIVEMFDGKKITMPSNVVTPSLRAELERRGVPFVETDNQGKPVEEDVIRYRHGDFVSGLESVDEVYDAFGELMKERHPLQLQSALEDYYGGTIRSASWGAKNAMEKKGLLPFPGDRYSGAEGEYHHIMFEREDGETFVEAVPFDTVDRVEARLPEKTESSTARFRNESLEEVNDRFNEQLGGFTAETADRTNFSLGYPSEELLLAGVADRPIRLHGSKVVKKMKKHGFSIDELHDLPKAVAHPIAVFDNLHREGNRSILTELHTANGNFLVTIDLGRGSEADFDIVSSVFGKNDKGIVDWIISGYTKYIDKEKALDYLHLSAPIAEASDKQELLSAANIVKDFENPTPENADRRRREATEAARYNASDYRRSISSRRLAAEKTANALGVRVNYVSRSEMPENGRHAAGYWKDGQICVCLENNIDAEDAVKTVLHEAVGHNGLRRLVGSGNMTAFCHEMFRKLPKAEREAVARDAVRNGGNLSEAVEEHLARLAETLNTDKSYERNLWDIIKDGVRRMLAKIGINVPLSQRDLRWLLWQSAQANRLRDPLVQARRQAMANRLGLSGMAREISGEAEDAMRFRKADEAFSADAASLYNHQVMTARERLRESYVDQFASVETLVDAIEKKSGKKARGFEDVRLSLNQQSSKGLAAMQNWERDHWKPIGDAVKKIISDTGMRLEDIERYVMLKHGLERNEVFAKRDAREYYRTAHDRKVAEIKAKDWEQDIKDEAVAREDAALADHITAIEQGTDGKYLENRRNDYGGLTGMYSEYDEIAPYDPVLETEEQFLARQKQARRPKYDRVEDMEAAAESEVQDFEVKAGDSVDALWKAVNGATKSILKHQYDSNMLSRQQYDAVRDMFRYYVPLRGFKDTEASDIYDYYRSDQRNDFSAPLVHARGRKTEARSPFGTIGAMASSAIAQDAKNEAKLALYYFVSNRPDNGLVTISDVWYEKEYDPDGNPARDDRGRIVLRPVYPGFRDDLSAEAAKEELRRFEREMEDKAKRGDAVKGDRNLSLDYVVHIDPAQEKAHIVRVKVGGKEKMMFINGNPRAAQAINGEFNLERSDGFNNFFQKWLRNLSGMNTSYNPEFWISNFQRDVLFSLMSASVKEDPEYFSLFRKNLVEARKVVAMNRALQDGTLGDSATEKAYREFVDNGGVTGYTVLKKAEEWDLALKKLTGDELAAVNGVKNAFEAVQQFGESVEQMTRFAAFLTSRQQGKGIRESVSDAKELTVNFNRKGSGKAIGWEETARLRTDSGRPLNKVQRSVVMAASWLPAYGRRWIMFFNAAVQGLNALYRLYRKDAKRTMMWASGYAALGAMNAVLHALLDDDDDYLDIPDYERRNNLLVGGKGAYFKWALPQEARLFYALGDVAVNRIMGREPHKAGVKGFATEIGTMIGDVLPVNPMEGWRGFVPSVIAPGIEVWQNEDYKGSKIYNDMRYLSDEERRRTPRYQKAYSGTGNVFIDVAEVLNGLTGGDYADAGWINLNPAAMEHLLEGYTGGAGTTVEKFLKATVGRAFGEEFSVRGTPFLSRLLTINDERYRNAHTTELFDFYKAEAEHTRKRLKSYARNGDDDRLDALYDSKDYEIMVIYQQYKGIMEYFADELKLTDDRTERKRLMREQDEYRKQMIKEISEIR